MAKHQRRNSRRKFYLFNGSQFMPKPWQCVIALAVLLCGSWFIMTRSLPYALATSHTEVGIWLSPNHPAPLMSKALQLRSRTREPDKASQTVQDSESKNTSEVLANDKKMRQLREKIARLSRQVLAAEPLNAKAYQLLGEVNQDSDKVRILMQAAVDRSRRSSTAVYWLLNDSTVRGDVSQALDYADILFRTRPKLARYVVAYIAHIAESGPEGFDAVVERLRQKPNWRGTMFRVLPAAVRDLTMPSKILVALKTSGSPIKVSEYGPYLNFLVRKEQIPFAYGAWLQFLPEERIGSIGLLNNADFDQPISDVPFDWQVGRSQNALTQFEPHPSRPQGLAFRSVFGNGQVNYAGMSQILLLAPGVYRLSGDMIGELEAKRGLQWQVMCATGRKLGGSQIIRGPYSAWTRFSVEFSVSEGPKCLGQIVKLSHLSRSASEKFIAGEIWFDNLSIQKVGKRIDFSAQ